MEPLVQLSEGQVQGTTKFNAIDEPFHSFLCIPYGKAPVGNQRFKAPQPVEPWEGVKDATKEENFCFQLNLKTQQTVGTEDCLSLHVFTKKLPKEEAKLNPVMVFIHGGGFTSGTHATNSYGPEYLMTEDIVLVNITYRLGFLGFLSFSDPSLDVPGNAGLKDQVLALKWIQRNIKNFNGDPNNVTIFGHSAGGASVEYLLLSQSAKNLFHRAIIQGGSALNPWARGRCDPADLANYLGKPNISEKELLKEITEMPIDQLYDIQMKYFSSKQIPGDLGIVAPVVEQPNPTAFLTKEPIDVLQSGEYNTVPVIIGYNDNEGALFLFIENMMKMANIEVTTEIKIEHLLPYETNLKDAEHVKKITQTLENYYYNEENKNNKTLLSSDAHFIAGIITSARNQAKVSKNAVYLYRFTLDAGLNLLKRMANLKDCPGACHGDEVGYLFKSEELSSLVSVEIGEVERTAQQRLISLWTNFAKYGNPTPKGSDLNIEWKPIENDELNFLNIGDELKMDVNPEAERMKVWHEIYQSNPRTAKF